MLKNAIPNQIQDLKKKLETIIPGNRIFSTVLNGKIAFWEGPYHPKLFEVPIGDVVTEQDIRDLLNGKDVVTSKAIKVVHSSKESFISEDVAHTLLELQKQLTRLDYAYYVLFKSLVPDQEYDKLDKEFHSLLSMYPDYKLPYQITRSQELASEYPQWVRDEFGE